jgi:hypothetical protein
MPLRLVIDQRQERLQNQETGEHDAQAVPVCGADVLQE